MAFTLSYVYEVVDRYTKPLDTIKKSTADFDKAVDTTSNNITKNTATMGQKLANFGNMAGVILGAATTKLTSMMLKAPSDAAISFETAMARVKKLGTFETEADFNRLRNEILKTGIELGKMPDDIASIVAMGEQLGIPADQLSKFTNIAAKTSVAFDMLEADASDALASIKNRLKLNIDETSAFMDAVNYLADNTAAKGEDMLNIISRTSGNMATIKLPENLVAGWASFASQIETTPQLAASGLNMLIEKMLKMEGATEKFALDPQGTIRNFLQSLTEIDAGQILDETTGLGVGAGGFALKAINNLELLDATLAKVSDSSLFAGSMQKELDIKLQTTQSQIEQSTSAWEAMKITVGDIMLPFEKKALPIIKQALIKFSEFAKSHPTLIKIGLAIAAITAVAVPLIVTIGMLAASIAAIGGVAVVGAIMGIVAAIGAIGVVIADNWDQVKEFFSMFSAENLKLAFEGFKEISSKAFDAILIKMTRVIDYAKMMLYVFTFQYDKAESIMDKINAEDAAKKAASMQEIYRQPLPGLVKPSVVAQSPTLFGNQKSKVEGTIVIGAEKPFTVKRSEMTSSSNVVDLGFAMGN